MSDKTNPVPEAPQTPQPEQATRKGTLMKKLLIGAVALIVLLVLLVLSIPTLLSTGPGKNFVLGFANGAIKGKIEADSISLGWFSGQSVTGFRLLDPQGQTVVSVAKIDMPSVRPLKLLDLSNDLGTITIDQPKIDIVKTSGDSTNLQDAIASREADSSSANTAGGSSSASTKIVGPRGVIDVKSLTLTASGFSPQPATVNIASLTADARDLGKLGLTLKGEALYGKDKGLLGADLSVQGLIGPTGELNVGGAKIVGTAEVRKLPLAVADALAGTKTMLVSLFGPELNLEIKTDLSQDSGTASLSVSTQNLSVTVPIVKQGSLISMDKSGAKVSLVILKDTANSIAAERNLPVRSERDVMIDLIITSLALPLVPDASNSKQMTVDLAKLKLDASLTASDVILNITANNIGRFEWKGTRAEISIPEELRKEVKLALRGGSPTTGGVNAKASARGLNADGNVNNLIVAAELDVDNVPVDVVDTLTNQEGKLVALLGKKLELVRVKAARNPDGKGGVFIALKSTNLNGDASVIVSPTAVLLDNEGSTNRFAMTMDRPALAQLQGPNPSVTFKQPLSVEVALKSFNLPLKEGAPEIDKLAFGAEVVVGDISAEMPGKPLLQWSRTVLKATSPALAQSAQIELTGGSAKTGKLVAKVTVDKPTADARVINATGDLSDFPVALADAFAAQNGKLVALLGDKVSTMRFDAVVAPGAPITVGLDLLADQAGAKLNATVDTKAKTVTLAKGNWLSLKLIPSAVELFMPADKTAAQRFEYTEGTDIRVNILEELRLGWTEPSAARAAAANSTNTTTDASAGAAPAMSLDPSRTSMNLAIVTSGGAVRMTRTSEVLRLGEGKTTIVSTNPAKEIVVKSSTAVQSTGGGYKIGPGAINVENLSVRNLKFEGFAPVLKGIDVDARVTGKNLPVELVDTYMGKAGQYSQLLGSDLDVSAGVQNFRLEGTAVPEMTGPLDLNIITRSGSSQVATFLAKAMLKDNILTYNEPGPITFAVTPELTKQYLVKISPFIQAVSGERPVSVTPQKGFSLPASNFDIKKVIGTLDLDLGTLKLQRGGLLTNIISLVGKFDSSVQKIVDTDYAVAFKPTSMTLKGGKLGYQGLSMKTGPIAMTYDANVDLVANTLEPGTSINIKGESFSGIKTLNEYIKPADVIKIGVTGPVSKPSIDTGGAAKQLAEIAAKGKLGEIIDKQVSPGVGGLINDVLGGGKSEQKPAETPKQGTEQKPEQKKQEDPLGGLINSGFNLLDNKKSQPKPSNPPATQPAK